ncbi:hypothetical protein GLOIN_2v1776801 [Rhizophagus clarus]|uniref:Transposase domain-containing protein n=1 Tax=Rhizophagus clarus TaxID=94130 RepID=A0A8H3LIQ4_9GLOM|nr:hypothetical protein GLOIN_2v1776801 [Rhizophagus clarus]
MSESLDTRTRTKVHCFYKECNGKLVDPRTKLKHELKYKLKSNANNNFGNNYQEGSSNVISSDAVDEDVMECDPIQGINDTSPDITEQLSEDIEQLSEDIEPLSEDIEPLLTRNYFFLTKKTPIHESAKHRTIKKGKISDLVLENLLLDNVRNENDQDGDSEDDDDKNGDTEDSDSNYSDDYEDDDDEEVNFASTDFDDGEPILPNININDNYTWTILWILQYQQRFKLSNVAIDSLFKFLRFFLLTIDENKFSSFPSSLYMAKKVLGISITIIKYAACDRCHKLYDIKELLDNTEIPTCSFVNYPNHRIERFRQQCNNPLLTKIDSNNSSNNPIFCPIMTFPLINIKQQLTLFFNRKNFEMSCRKWSERKNGTEALFDIYDGRVWKSFTDDDGALFFTKKFADTHIRLMLNMDWFQPFVNSQYSVGVIYAVFCNLPRNERFKPHNILTLAVMPGLKEPSQHEINNYFRFVRGAIISCSSDVSASQKLCGFISARIACYRCYKSANFINNQPNFGGFADLDDWFVERDINEIREKASEWKQYATEEARRAHVSEHHVRWSEIYRLLYFNPVRFCVIDPMHCLFLGVAKWIVTKLWIGEGILNNEKLKIMQERADMIKFPSDLGRRPVRIATGEGFSSFTADMWKTFMLIFAIPITWSFLGYIDRKFLHISFERMNGILGSYNNSRRNIEPELLRIMSENTILQYFLSNCDNDHLFSSLKIIEPRKSVGSLAALDDFASDEYQNFIRLSLIEEDSAYGTECFPGLLMKPRKETTLPNQILDLLVEFYNSLYNDYCFISIYSIIGSNNGTVINPRIIQYGRIRIGADIYGSVQAARHEKSSYILARFVHYDGSIDVYPGQVQFYFEHTIHLNSSRSLTHSLALVKWYKPVQDHSTRYYCQVDNDIKSCNMELWTNEFYDMRRDSIIPIHHIIGKFIKCNFDTGTRKTKEYMAVIPLNKKISF